MTSYILRCDGEFRIPCLSDNREATAAYCDSKQEAIEQFELVNGTDTPIKFRTVSPDYLLNLQD